MKKIKMKAIQSKCIITSIRAKVDGSLGFSGVTPEYSVEEKVAFMQLQNQELELLITPVGFPNAPTLVVDKDVRGKSLTQQLYAVLFVLWEQSGRPHEDFEVFRKIEMRKFIDVVKDNLQ